MLNLQPFADGKESIEECLSRYGMTVGNRALLIDGAKKSISSLLMTGYITPEEAQKIFHRIIADIGRHLREVK